MSTLGTTSVGGTNSFVNRTTNNLQVFGPFTLSVDATFSKISWYLRSGTGYQWYGYIYADSSGTPGTFKGLTQKFSGDGVNDWADASFASPLSLPAGVYWVGVKCGDSSSGNLLGAYDTGVGRHYATGITADGSTANWSDAGSDNVTFSCYATYTQTAPANTVAPAVTGTAKVGSVLSSSSGTWTGTSPTFTYQWQRGGVDIGSATANTYTLVDADDATNVRCVVTGTNGGGSATANSNAVAVTEPVPTISVAPAVTGTTAVGDTLTCDTGTWTHQGGTVHTYAYQWKRDGSNIAGQTAATHVIVTADQGTALTCAVTATNTGGAGSPATSNSTSIAAASTGTTGALLGYLYTHGRI